MPPAAPAPGVRRVRVEDRGETRQPGIERRDIARIGALLRPEDRRRAAPAEKGIRHVAQHRHSPRRQRREVRQIGRHDLGQATAAVRDGPARGIRESCAEGSQHAGAAVGR